MRVRQRKNMNLYRQSIQQRGGFPVYRARRRFRGGGLGSLFKGAFKAFGKPLLKVGLKAGKNVLKSIGPKLAKEVAETGADLVSGKTTLKKALKKTAKQTKKAVVKGTRTALERELAAFENKQRGGQLMVMKRGKTKLRRRD